MTKWTCFLPFAALVLPFAALHSDTLADRLRTLAKCVRAALRHLDMSIDTAAREQEMDAAQFQRELGGVGHLSGKRLAKLPVGFWQYFGLELLKAFGLPAEVETAAKLQPVLESKRRMARMDAVQAADRRSA